MPAVWRDVFDADRKAVQRADRLALHHGLLGALGVVPRVFFGQCHDRIEFRVECFDRGKMRVEHVEGTDGARADEPRQFTRRLAHQSIVTHTAQFPAV